MSGFFGLISGSFYTGFNYLLTTASDDQEAQLKAKAAAQAKAKAAAAAAASLPTKEKGGEASSKAPSRPRAQGQGWRRAGGRGAQIIVADTVRGTFKVMDASGLMPASHARNPNLTTPTLSISAFYPMSHRSSSSSSSSSSSAANTTTTTTTTSTTTALSTRATVGSNTESAKGSAPIGFLFPVTLKGEQQDIYVRTLTGRVLKVVSGVNNNTEEYLKLCFNAMKHAGNNPEFSLTKLIYAGKALNQKDTRTVGEYLKQFDEFNGHAHLIDLSCILPPDLEDFAKNLCANEEALRLKKLAEAEAKAQGKSSAEVDKIRQAIADRFKTIAEIIGIAKSWIDRLVREREDIQTTDITDLHYLPRYFSDELPRLEKVKKEAEVALKKMDDSLPAAAAQDPETAAHRKARYKVYNLEGLIRNSTRIKELFDQNLASVESNPKRRVYGLKLKRELLGIDIQFRELQEDRTIVYKPMPAVIFDIILDYHGYNARVAYATPFMPIIIRTLKFNCFNQRSVDQVYFTVVSYLNPTDGELCQAAMLALRAINFEASSVSAKEATSKQAIAVVVQPVSEEEKETAEMQKNLADLVGDTELPAAPGGPYQTAQPAARSTS